MHMDESTQDASRLPAVPVHDPGAGSEVHFRPSQKRPRPIFNRRPRARVRRTLRRVAALLIALLFLAIAFPYVHAMMAPSSLPLSIRSVEWLRDNGGAGLVDQAERVYYTATAPKAGGPGLKSLPSLAAVEATQIDSASLVGSATADEKLPPAETTASAGPARAGAAPAQAAPPRVVSAVVPPLAGEGVWERAGRSVLGANPIWVTEFRPEAAYPRQVAYAAWIDVSRVHLELYAGRVQPLFAGPRGPMEVPQSLRKNLLATFNSGFTTKGAHGGFAVHGRTLVPMRTGQGTLIEYTDGRVELQTWTGGSNVGTDVVFARQNLPLLVDGGQPNPTLHDDSKWGFTLGNTVRVWRTAIGIDSAGNVMYVAAPGQTATSIASAMVRLGAVRALELDINSAWPTFNIYRGAGGAGASKLVPNPRRPATRYFTPDDRDFFVVYAAPALKNGVTR